MSNISNYHLNQTVLTASSKPWRSIRIIWFCFFGPHPTVLRDHYWQSSENHLGSQGLNLGWLHGKQVFGVLYCYSSSRSTCFSGRKGVKQRAGGGWHVLQRQHLTLNLSIHPVPQISLLATGRRWTNPLALSLELILEPKTSLF